MSPEDDSEQINAAPLLRALDERREHIAYLERLYADNPMPISMLATMAGVQILDGWPGLMAMQQFKINCAIGTTEERNQAIKLLTENDSGYVLEPYSLFTVVSLGVHEALTDTFGEFTVTQSTIDLYDEHILNYDQIPSSGTMAKIGDNYIMDSMTDDRRRDRIQPFKDAVAWAKKNCHIIPAVEDLPASWIDLTEQIHPTFIDAVLAAKAKGAILVSDDLFFRSLALQDTGVAGVWLQPLLMFAKEHNKISHESYCESVVQLADAGLHFISIDGSCLYWSVSNDHDELSERSKNLLDLITKPTVELPSSFRVCAEFLFRLWHSEIPREQMIGATHQLLNSYHSNLPKLIGRLAWVFWKKAQMWKSNQSENCQDAIVLWSEEASVTLQRVKTDYERRLDVYRQRLLGSTCHTFVAFPQSERTAAGQAAAKQSH